ncbi:MAG: hypothetical protein Q9222_006956 [Ikaeria aurantiellina]
MGKFEGIDRYTFSVSTERDQCMFRCLESKIMEERVLVVGSLEDLESKESGNLTAIPMLGPHEFTATDVRERVANITPEIAEDFGFKIEVQAEAPFRLIQPSSLSYVKAPQGRLPSFIALSYCWQSASLNIDRDSADSIAMGDNFTWPISRSMVKALLLERTSVDEGLWIDQCCINQQDPQEKSRAIGFMNLIYKQARVVVVVLEDIVLDEAETFFLESLMRTCSSRQPTEPGVILEQSSFHHVVRLAMKIFSARWFTRAWCNHELLVSQNHVFLIGTGTEEGNCPKVLKFTLPFLNSLVNIVASYDYTGAQDPHHSELTTQIRVLGQRGFLHIIFNPFGLGGAYNLDDADHDHSISRYMKSLMETSRNLSKYGASVASDKLAITLNIVGSGLYYKGPERLDHECGLLISVVALAAGDPAVLCCSGARYEFPGSSGKSTWFQQPAKLDFAGKAGRKGTYRRLDYVPSFSLDQIILDFFYIASTSDTSIIRRASEPFLARARWYIDSCIEMSKVDPMFQLGATFADHKETKIRVLACALECGPRWINEASAAKTSADYPDSDLEQAIEIFTPFRRLDGAQVFRALTEEHREMYEVWTDFVETLTLDYVSPIGPSGWSPAWVQVGSGEMDRLLFMCPAEQDFTAMVPTLLQHADYTDCKRVFLLRQSSSRLQHDSDTWTVLGKSLGFGMGLDVLSAQHTNLREHQIIRA